MIYTYIIYDNLSKLFKIGKSKNLKKRLQTLSTGNLNLEIVYIIVGDKEKFLQRFYYNKKVSKEWFNLNINDLKDLKDFQFETNKEFIAG